jgi:hypothetical protein
LRAKSVHFVGYLPREQAERKAGELLKEHPFYERLELKEYPRGFRIVMTHLPGRIEEDAGEF